MKLAGPCLWFDGNAEQAAAFYVSVFPNSRILQVARYLQGSPGAAGTVMTVRFMLDGSEFLALNGGSHFKFSPAISFVVDCDTQQEVDRMWERLLDGGQENRCGWLQDRFGVSWQIVPTALPAMLTGPDMAAAQRVFSAMLQMKKIDIATLERAHRHA
jgi:predicted 3-demethylubiquinone-9 3-methyltransferase (glyoxalase superfamily)